jgi:metallo-beta-lactamase class B
MHSMRRLLVCIVLALATNAALGAEPAPCGSCAAWNVAQPPFRIFGNTYYVGVRGLSSILITSNEGHVLIDGGLPESVPNIAASIRSLGFRIEDVKLILNSHVHHDHAGGIAELQRLSGAVVAASSWSAAVLRTGDVGRADPQFGTLPPIAPVAQVRSIGTDETLRVGPIALTPHFTPGHTPGGTSWAWRSCEGERCLDIVYPDSLTAVSSPGFLFTRSPDYPEALRDFERSFTVLSSLPCDILLTPHPDFSDMMGKLESRTRGAVDPFVNTAACREFVERARDGLSRRIASEMTAQP